MITKVTVHCSHCGKDVEKYVGHVNRAKKEGAKLFCNQTCFGLSRRMTDAEKKELKRLYDIEYRKKNEKRLKKVRHEYFVKDYAANPEKYREQRRKKQAQHNEYCRTKKYRKWKQNYDQQHRAKKWYGEFWEAAITLRNLQGVVDNRTAKQEQKVINKTQNRKRYANKNTKRKELESCTMGIYQPR